MKKKYLGLIVVFIILAVICITAGVTYAVFNYRKEGKVDNVITSGKITFRYDEDSVNGINLTSAVPMTDRKGASLEGEGNVFDFTVSTQGTDAELYYNIELALTENSDLAPSIVKVYLAEVVDGVEKPSYYVLSNYSGSADIRSYSELTNNSDNTAKLIGVGGFSKSDVSQERQYRLKIWIDKDADFSPTKNGDGTYYEDENGDYLYRYSGKSFGVRVNVKATASIEDVSNIGAGDAGIDIECDDAYCMSETPVILPDGSNWKLLTDYHNGDETISLIYDDYIDENGDYSTSEVLVYCYLIDNILNNFTSKIKKSLNDKNIIVSLPKASQIYSSFFDANYNDEYFLSYQKFPGRYYFEEKNLSINWHTKNNRLTYVSGADAGIKPVITVSSDYLSFE